MHPFGERRRSLGFLEHEDESWACFLVTHAGAGGRCHGLFSFRPKDGETAADEVRTADIFIEDHETDVHEKARGLGRPLLRGLLSSALHTSSRKGRPSLKLRRQFRALLAESARELVGSWIEEAGSVTSPGEFSNLESLYASYRLDQVAHFIALIDPVSFEGAVDRILSGEQIDFRATERIQFAMMVVEYIERHLPLPPFDVWARDFQADPEAYRLYAHTLHREGRLP